MVRETPFLSDDSALRAATSDLLPLTSYFLIYARTRKDFSKQERQDDGLWQVVRSRGRYEDHELPGAV